MAVFTDEGKTYHVRVGKGDIGRYVLLPGDPFRTDLIASYFDDAKLVAHNREHKTWTGTLNGVPVSVVSTGMGCPSMGDEVLEESTMEPFVEEIEGSVSGKTLGLFGSYGWGDGQWMRDWTDRMKQAGASVIGGEDAICNGAPDADAEAALKELGKRLAAI